MTTQIFEVSTAFGLATLAAALDDGLFAAADRRILAISNNATIPEAATGPDEVAGVTGLLGRFDAVYSYNEFVAPQHPSVWRPGGADAPRVARHLQLAWQVPDLLDVQLIVESIQVPPALTLATVFGDARIDVYADGLMSYGPTRTAVPAWIGTRVERLLHLDLVPGLEPMLLTEFDVPAARISQESFIKIIDGLRWSPDLGDRAPESVAVVVGQYLAALDLLSVEEEDDLYAGIVGACATAGFSTVVFKPHPAAPIRQVDRLRAVAQREGVELLVAHEPSLVECWYRHPAVGLVAGCFSTALLTAAFFDRPAGRAGTAEMLRRLRPYENSNRIPLTLVDAVVLPIGGGSPVRCGRLPDLVATVSYCMQPERYPSLRSAAEVFLAATLPTTARYVGPQRSTELGLPGRARPRPAALPRRLYRSVRRRLRSVSGAPNR